MKKLGFTLIIALIMIMFGTSCKEKINIFSIQDDINFGAQFDEEILKNKDFVILPETQYPEAYRKINQFKTTLLNTGKMTHVNDFNWTVRIIRDDATINAFAVPGGYLYFYTGLIKALDNEAEFAGVMAHEMAHADRRHSTAQLTKQYGIDLLLSMLLGKNSNQWVNIAANLASGLTELAFSRSDENEADKYAVNNTYVTEWDARGVADFLKKMDSHSPTPVFLSTHPSDKDRIAAVEKEWKTLGGKQGEYFASRYAEFVNSLP
ncbi:MAG: M48 family metalloprotease [Bacteroidetes bacterium]|nr:M48 family metalloprotease [Bacteroidota bacterium]MCL1968929.1 M48 family metalloprotease [Bacteroidota bacterium]